MPAVLLALFSSLSYGVSDYLGGLKSRTLPVITVLLVSHAAALVAITATLALATGDMPSSKYFVYAMLAGVAEAVGLAALYQGLAVGKMSIVAAVAAVSPAVPVIASVATGEAPGAILWFGIIVAIGGAAALVVILPFALRSSYVTRSFVPFDLRAGSSLCLGRLPEADGGPIDFDRCPFTAGAPAVQANRERLDEAWRLLRANPGREPGLMVGRMEATLWADDRSGIDQLNSTDGRDLGTRFTDRAVTASTLWSRVVLVLAATGTVLALIGRRRWLAVTTAAGWLLLSVPLISLGDARFRVPSLPFFAVGAAAAVVTAARASRRRPDSPFPAGGAGR